MNKDNISHDTRITFLKDKSKRLLKERNFKEKTIVDDQIKKLEREQFLDI